MDHTLDFFFFIFKYSMEKKISTRGQEAERLQDKLIKGKWNKTGVKAVEYLSERPVRKQTDWFPCEVTINHFCWQQNYLRQANFSKDKGSGVHKQEIQCYGTRIGVGSAEDLRAERNTTVQACARESSQRMTGLLRKWFVSPFRAPNSNDLTTPMPHFTQTPSSANITAVRIKVPTQKHWETHSKHIHIIADSMSQYECVD